VTYFLWLAGSAEGVTDDEAKAREYAIKFMSAGPGSAVIQQAVLIDGGDSMTSRYRPLPTLRWVGHRRRGGGITWKLQPLKVPALAAALQTKKTIASQDIIRDDRATNQARCVRADQRRGDDHDQPGYQRSQRRQDL
jgi:hypothetical protein